MNFQELPPLLTVNQVAKICQCHGDTIKKMIRTQELPGIRLGAGGDWRIPKTAVQKLIAAIDI